MNGGTGLTTVYTWRGQGQTNPANGVKVNPPRIAQLWIPTACDPEDLATKTPITKGSGDTDDQDNPTIGDFGRALMIKTIWRMRSRHILKREAPYRIPGALSCRTDRGELHSCMGNREEDAP